MDANSTENVSRTSLRVLMLPMLGHGHISPFLELAKKLTERGFHIYLCSTSINLNHGSKSRSRLWSRSGTFHIDLPQLPSRYHTTDGLAKHLLPILYKSLALSIPEIHKTIKALNPDMVIYDQALTWFSITPLHHIPSVWLHIVSVAALSYAFHLALKPGSEYPFPATSLRDFELQKLLAAIGHKSLDVGEGSSLPLLVNTSRAMEGKYLDHLASITNLKVLPVGPLIPTSPNAAAELEEEIEEIAFGLELSHENFIWALRSPPEGIEFGVPIIAMPMAFEQPINGRVLVENSVAIEITRDENGRLKREEIAKAINNVVTGCAGEPLRQKMKDLRKQIKSSEKENLQVAQLSKKSSGHHNARTDFLEKLW
nr:beta-D-glucosyl crocetin beta-1,6-glucosyltransferase-like [Coffea arabica]